MKSIIKTLIICATIITIVLGTFYMLYLDAQNDTDYEICSEKCNSITYDNTLKNKCRSDCIQILRCSQNIEEVKNE